MFLKEITQKKYNGSFDYFRISMFIFIIIFIFSILYEMIYVFDANSFSGVSRKPANEIFDFLYFSVVTFTTLGYGDIQPVSILARSVVMVEVLLFVVYISIILLSVNRGRKNDNEKLQ